MSVIGRYIHLTKRGYEGKHDYAHPNRYDGYHPFYDEYQSAKRRIEEEIESSINSLKTGVSQSDLDKMSNIYNRLLDSHKSGGASNDSTYYKMMEGMLQAVKDDFLSGIQGEKYSVDGGTFKVSKDVATKMGSKVGSSSSYKRASTIFNAIKRVQDGYNKVFKDLSNAGLQNTKPLHEYQKVISDIQNAVNELQAQVIKKGRNEKGQFVQGLDRFEDYTGEVNESSIQRLVYTMEALNGTSVSFGGKQGNIIDALNYVISALSMPDPAVVGEAFEHFIDISSKKVAKLAFGEATEAISAVVGKNGGRSGYVTANFDDYQMKAIQKLESGIYSFGDGEFISTFNVDTQDKVDVTLKIDKNKDYRISAKNYNLYANQTKGVSLVSGTPFLSLVQSVNADFVNHYFNLVVPHTAYFVSPTARGPRIQYIVQDYAEKKEVNDIMSRIILIKAISGEGVQKFNANSGSTYFMNPSNVFMINDSSKGKIKMYSMGELIKTMLRNQSYNIEGFPIDFSSLRGYVSPASPDGRIYKILSLARSVKISAYAHISNFI